MLEIKITRTRVKSQTTDGYLTIGGQHICETAENTRYCLPAGSYHIQFDVCNQYGKKMPRIVSIDNRLSSIDCKATIDNRPSTIDIHPRCSKCLRKKLGSMHGNLPCYCPMIKVGNGAYNRTDGSIIVGEYLQPGILLHSGNAFEKLYQRIKKATQRETEIRLIIQ